MCEIKTSIKGKDMQVVCETSGKPIIKSNRYGMFCEDMCGLQESKQADAQIRTLLTGLLDRCKFPGDEV